MPMSLYSMLKRNSKLALRGSWGRAILASAVLFGASAALSMVQNVLLQIFAPPVDIDPVLAMRYGFSEYFFEQFTHIAPLELGILGLFLAVELLLLVPLGLGVLRWHFLLVQEGDPAIAEIFYFFENPRRFGRAIWLHVNLFFRCLFWSVLLLLLPAGILAASTGVIAMGEETGRQLSAIASAGVLLGILMLLLALFLYFALVGKYLPASYLLCESDDITVRQAIRDSIRFTRGYRFSLLWYQLSFIGWALLCVFVLPILYVLPYVSTSVAMYARYIIERGRFTPQGPTREFRAEDADAFHVELPHTPQPDVVEPGVPPESWPGPLEENAVPAPPAPFSLPELDPLPTAPVPQPQRGPEVNDWPPTAPPQSPVAGYRFGPLPDSRQEPAARDVEEDPAIWPEPDQPFRDREREQP